MVGGAWVLRILRRARHRPVLRGRDGFEAVQHRGTRRIHHRGRYSHLSFGSWLIRVTHVPALRLVWDGKAGWAILEVETADLHQGKPIWRELWIGRHKEEHRASNVVRILVKHARREPED
jgi:hypothetical protein